MNEAELKEHYEIVSKMPLIALWDILDDLDRTRFSGTYFDAEANLLETEAVNQQLLIFKN